MMACLIFSTYQLIMFLEKGKTTYLVFGSFGIGIGMLTKGPMGLVFPLSLIFIHLVANREIKKILDLRWIL